MEVVLVPDNSQQAGSECDASASLRNDGGSNLASSVAALRNTAYGLVTIAGISEGCTVNLQFVSHGKTENLHCTVRKLLGLGAIDTS
ncbi:MAG: hypothetical protein ACREOY_02810, partial [Candidatus Dormibacteraceae bacterium]